MTTATCTTEPDLLDRVEAYIDTLTPADVEAIHGRFPRLAILDAVAVVMQRPDATDVRPYVAWLYQGRRVRHGEHGIVLPPTAVKRSRARVFDVDQTDEDPDAQASVRGRPARTTIPTAPVDLTAPETTRLGKPPRQPLPLATSRYQSWNPAWSDKAVPVRITVGHPRFVRYPMARALSLAPWELFPNGRYREQDPKVEILIYYRRMEAHAAEILAELAAVAAAHPGKTGVLMCYENVHAGEICHRRWAADWFHARYGWDVPEIGVPRPALPDPLRLF